MEAAGISIKRAYEPPSPSDGRRILVDRLWPRGLKREGAAIDLWVPDVAPSSELRRWFGTDVSRWPEFVRRYRDELADPDHAAALDVIIHEAREGAVTLLFAKRDTVYNNAAVLKELVTECLRRS